MSMPQLLAKPELGAWRAGNTGTEGVWRFDSGRPGRHLMISALVHGNELCGAWALLGLLERGLRPARGSLTLAFCNLEAFDRFDPAHHDAARFVDEDLNRQWSAERLSQPTSRERRRAAALRPFVEAADWLLDLHSMHERSAPLLLTGLQPRHLALARSLHGEAAIVIDAGHADGVRMRDFGRFGQDDAQSPESRSLLLECGYHLEPQARLVAQDYCVRLLEAAELLDAAELARLLPGWRRPDAAQPAPALRVRAAVVARSERFRFSKAFSGLECIPQAGTVIGDNEGEPVVTPFDDCVLVMPSTRQARAGVTVVRLAERV